MQFCFVQIRFAFCKSGLPYANHVCFCKSGLPYANHVCFCKSGLCLLLQVRSVLHKPYLAFTNHIRFNANQIRDLCLDLLKRAELAHFHAETAAVAHGGIDADAAVFIPGEGGAAGLQAGTAVDTFVRDGLHLVGMHFALEEGTGSLSDDDRQFILLRLFLEDSGQFIRVEWIDDVDVLNICVSSLRTLVSSSVSNGLTTWTF